MISQEDGKRAEIQAFERKLHAIAQIEEGSIDEDNLSGRQTIFFFKSETSSPMFGVDPAL